MNFDDVQKAMSDAQQQLNLLDRVADRLAGLLVGRLRKVSSGYTLSRLKMELRDYNAHTNTWK